MWITKNLFDLWYKYVYCIWKISTLWDRKSNFVNFAKGKSFSWNRQNIGLKAFFVSHISEYKTSYFMLRVSMWKQFQTGHLPRREMLNYSKTVISYKQTLFPQLCQQKCNFLTIYTFVSTEQCISVCWFQHVANFSISEEAIPVDLLYSCYD